MANKPIIPFNPNGPVLSGSNDTSDTKPYVGKPKPMPPTTRPPGMGYSPGGGSFDASSLRRAPRPTMILPGQGQGPMPVGTKPLPNPVVKDTRGGGGGLEDWIKSHPGGMNPDEDGGWVRKEYDPTKNANVNNPLWDGYRGGAPTADMGDNRLYRDPSTQPGNPEFRNFRGDMGMIRDGGQWGQRWQPGLSGNGEYAGVTTPGSWVDNGDPNAPRMHAMGGQGGPRGGMVGIMRDGRINPDGSVSGRNDQNGWDQWHGGGQIGFNNDPRYGGRMGSLSPDGNGGYLTPDGRTVQIPNYGGMMKPPAMPGGESVAPGMGMLTQYGGGPSGRGGVEVPYDGMNGAIQRGPGAPGMPSGGKPPQGPQPGMPGQGGGQRPQRPQRPQQGGGANPQAMQQGAQALYSDNTIPHEFKGQLLQAAQSGNAQAFNEMLFNSNIPHETKLKLQQMFGYGGQGGGVQAATPDQLTQQVQGVTDAYNGSKGSPYYGAF